MDLEVLAKFKEKLEPSIQNLREGKFDDHDIFPALLGALLEYAQNNQLYISQAFKTLEQKHQQIEVNNTNIADKLTQNEHSQEAMLQGAKQLEIKTDEIINTLAAYEKSQEAISQNNRKALENLKTALQEEGSKYRGRLESIELSIAELEGSSKRLGQGIKHRMKWLRILLIVNLALIVLVGIVVFFK